MVGFAMLGLPEFRGTPEAASRILAASVRIVAKAIVQASKVGRPLSKVGAVTDAVLQDSCCGQHFATPRRPSRSRTGNQSE
jgi:hypothetical protein